VSSWPDIVDFGRNLR
jgi:ribosomal protein L21/ribosomal protein L27